MKVRVIDKIIVGNPTIGQNHLVTKNLDDDWVVCALSIKSLTEAPRFSVSTYPPAVQAFRRLLIDLHNGRVQEILLPIRYLSEMNQLSKDSVVQNLLEVDLSGISTQMVVPQDFANIIAKQ